MEQSRLDSFFTHPAPKRKIETFSSLRHLNNYLRSSMRHMRHCTPIKQRTDDLDLIGIARDFTEAKSQRKGFFGNFKIF